MDCVKLVFFMLYTFLCQLAFSSSPPHLCPKDQALALLQFKNMFTINPDASYYCDSSHPRTLFWNNSTDCCSWDGVHCDKMTGQVIELDLHCSQLQGFAGIIPSEISHLSKLHVLRIGGQYKLSLGPHNFELLLKNLTQLRDLNLWDVNLSSTIPSNFSSHLAILTLYNTGLRGLLPERFFHLTDLESLDLSFNPQLTVRFPTTKWNSSASLMYLNLYNVNFTGRIPESFSHLTAVQELDMSHSNLLGPILWNLTSIEILYLNNNHLEGPISHFSRFKKLKTLSLGNNNFDGRLEFLSFNRSWMQLEILDFSSNSLTGPIPSNVSGLQNLRQLILSSSHLNGTIPSWIFDLPSLRLLDLSNNTFSGKIQEFKSKTLAGVYLYQNQLEGPLPNSLLNQPILMFLLLSHNSISGQIASTICNLTMLTVLNLRSNNLEGTIPQCLGEMNENLWSLDLSNNSLSGTIDTTFSIRNSFRVISLHGNKLTGKVPPSLIICTYLTLLDLGNNQLNDTFPNWLGDLPYLKILSLRSNKFHGPVKSSRNTNLFPQLQIMDLSSNGFSGNLPISLFGNLQAMKKIDVNTRTPQYVSDQFAGYYDYLTTITTKGQDFESVQIFATNIIIDLSRNRFEGHIPSIIGDLVGLRTLNLSHNVLEGHIPASLQNLSVLESLDLSSNKLDGEIPQQLVSLTSLEVLNLSHNHLVGCIPKGKQFDTFENNSYLRNDGLRGLPPSRDCGRYDRVPQSTIPLELDQEEEEEEDSPMISWQAVLMGYGCGLVIGLSVIYIMWSTQYPAWFSRMDVKLEHIITTRMKKHKKRY
ncbi:receptor-like protein Cf-9 isoform X2 [Solanum pennellii]|uniref:Receptor-like protein Cf-9 isoform X2 n=1 Tax=Solanum pennellii TaxID=28526 RepID=A0ABM1V5K2_SOLPN|nr:receptor-like protein Cf-9 isoform X2 [Solanum pennellii]